MAGNTNTNTNTNAKTMHGNPLAWDRVREPSGTWHGAGNTNTNIKDNAIC